MLRATYADLALRRWFARPRARFGGRSPAELLSGDWSPGDANSERVFALAKESLI